jgi:hypothetical protein
LPAPPKRKPRRGRTQTLLDSVRGLEAKGDAERATLEARARAERGRHADEVLALEADANAARERCLRLQRLFEGLAAEAAALWQGAVPPTGPLAVAPDGEAAGGAQGRLGSYNGSGWAGAAGHTICMAPTQPGQWGRPRWLYRHCTGAWRMVEGTLRELSLDASAGAAGMVVATRYHTWWMGATASRRPGPHAIWL